MIRLSTVALATLLVASASSAMAQSRVEVGILECRGSTTSFIVGSVTDLGCVFRPAGGGPTEPYRATLRRAGVDLGFNQQIVVAWAVWAPTGAARYELAGKRGWGGQRYVRRWPWRQRAVRGVRPDDRSAAAERTGPDRPERRRRYRGPG